MTTALHAVTSPWAISCLAAYLVLVALVLGANHTAHRKPSPDPVFRIVNHYPPALPPVAESDAAWVSVWPSAVDDDALCDAEFMSLISTTWDWPDREDAA